MNKYLVLIAIIIFGIVLLLNPFKEKAGFGNKTSPNNETNESTVDEEKPPANMPNPASKYCEENGGSLEIVTNKDGSQFAMCKFEDYSCEEWAYYKGECTVEEDAARIKTALIAKGLNLTEMKIVIRHHFGKYIGGSVLPISEPAGGGYVFAVKVGDDVKIVADGNGIITCEMLEDYPDYPTYLISDCVDAGGNLRSR